MLECGWGLDLGDANLAADSPALSDRPENNSCSGYSPLALTRLLIATLNLGVKRLVEKSYHLKTETKRGMVDRKTF